MGLLGVSPLGVGGSFGCGWVLWIWGVLWVCSEFAQEPLECEGLPYTEKLLLKDTSKMYVAMHLL